MASARIAKIGDDTPILPHIVADGVIDGAAMLVAKQSECTKREGCDCPSCELHARKVELANLLTDQADTVYGSNPSFAKLIRGRGDSGRDRLYGFMQHWLAAELKRSSPEVFSALPQGYGWDYRGV